MKAIFSKYTIFTLLLAGVLFAACNKKLEVNPVDSVSPESIKTGADVKAVLYGAYDQMVDYHTYGEQYLLISDLLADQHDFNFTSTYVPYVQIFNKDGDRYNSVADGMWEYGYQVINTTNIVLDKLSLVDEDEQAAVGAEAKFIRALMYFNLSNFYGKPYSDGNLTANLTVPLVLTSTLSATDASKALLPRATVQAMYTQLEKDLQDAVAGLPEDNGTRANKFAAEAILSRIYMAEGNYPQAAAMADSVIEKGPFIMNTNFSAAFSNTANSTEDIFAIQQNAQRNGGVVNNGIYAMYSPDVRGDAQISTVHLNLYETGDVRRDFFITAGDSLYTSKWSVPYTVIPVVRLAEMYLTRGEANLRAGAQVGSATPLEDITTVRDRSNASTLTVVTADDFVQERFRELAFEGDKFLTERRTKMDIGPLPYNSNKLVLPVPDRERQVNTKLEQNPGY